MALALAVLAEELPTAEACLVELGDAEAIVSQPTAMSSQPSWAR